MQPSMQDAPAPVQLAPARQVPARSIPAQSASAQSTSAQSAPAPQGPAPVQSTPARSAPAPQTGPPPARSVPADRPGASPALPQSDGDTQFPDAAFVRLHWVEIIEKMGQMGSVFPSLLRNFRGVEADGFTSHIFLLDPTTVNQFDRMGGSEKLALILSNMLDATVSVQAHWIEDLDNVIAGFGRGDESAEAEREPRADVEDSQTDEKIVATPSDAQSPGDFDGPEPVEPPEEELSAFDLDGEE